MTIDDKITDEKLQCDIDKEAAKILALSSGKTDKYEYLTGEEILPFNQRQIIRETKLIYIFYFRKSFWKKKTGKQVDAIKSLYLFNKTHELKETEGIFQKSVEWLDYW